MSVIQRIRVKAVWLDWKGRDDWCTCLHQRHFEDKRCTDLPPPPISREDDQRGLVFEICCNVWDQEPDKSLAWKK